VRGRHLEVDRFHALDPSLVGISDFCITAGARSKRGSGTSTHLEPFRPQPWLDCLAEAAQIIEMTDERYDEAELHRLRGDLLNATSDRAAAEQNYHRALTVARHQGRRASTPKLVID
jgi:hypothetical protein